MDEQVYESPPLHVSRKLPTSNTETKKKSKTLHSKDSRRTKTGEGNGDKRAKSKQSKRENSDSDLTRSKSERGHRSSRRKMDRSPKKTPVEEIVVIGENKTDRERRRSKIDRKTRTDRRSKGACEGEKRSDLEIGPLEIEQECRSSRKAKKYVDRELGSSKSSSNQEAGEVKEKKPRSTQAKVNLGYTHEAVRWSDNEVTGLEPPGSSQLDCSWAIQDQGASLLTNTSFQTSRFSLTKHHPSPAIVTQCPRPFP